MYKRVSQRLYTGPVKTAILDFSGTTIDKYVLAPALVFVKVFAKHNVPISMIEARKPMGLRKDLHIKALTEDEDIREKWRFVYDRYPDDTDVDNMFKDFVPMQLDCLSQYTSLLPNINNVISTLRKTYNMKIGITTGFTTPMVKVILEECKKQGFVPDSAVAGNDVLNGARPKPFMVYKNLDLLDAYPIQSVVKVDDVVGGVQEGLNAGCWSVGVSRFSNYMDIDSFEHAAELKAEELEDRNKNSRKILEEAGAHYVIDTLEELPNVIKDINKRLKKGEQP